MKKLFLKLLALVACLSSALSATAYDFSYEYNGKTIYFNYDGQISCQVTYKDTNYNSNTYIGDVTIPPLVLLNGWTYYVTGIGENAFRNCTNLTSVNIPVANLGYFSIGATAFDGCTNLSSVTIPEGTNTIGRYAFYDCRSLTSINIPVTVTSIGEGAFYSCTSLTSVAIPTTVTSLGEKAFRNCSSLTNAIIGEGITAIENETFDGCCALTNVTIGSNVTSIGEYAFCADSCLTQVVIPDKVTTIGRYAFRYCRHITKMTVGSSVTSIGFCAFDFQGTYTVNGTSILRQAEFHMKSLNPPTIDYASFGGHSSDNNLNPYYRHQIYTVNPYSRSLYKADAYWSYFRCLYNSAYDNLVEQKYDFYTGGIYYLITGPNTAKVTNKMGGGNLMGASNQYSYSGNVTIPNTAYYSGTGKTYNVTGIDDYAFCEQMNMMLNNPAQEPTLRGSQGDLKSVTVGNNVTTIEDYAFLGCSGLTSVTLGSGVTSIGANAFNGCTSLTTVNSNRTTPPTIQSTTFDNSHYSSTTVKVPSSYVNSYKAANYWKNFYLILPNNGTDLNYVLNVSGGNINFTSTGDYPWIVKGDGTRTYAQSGNAGVASSSSTLSASVTVSKASIVSFDFKAWGEGTSYDKCIFSIDGTAQFSYGARDNDWETYTADLPAGTHTLTWTYQKDGSVNPEGDYFAVDNVAIVAKPVSIGDVDGDGQVNIADVTALIDLLLAGTTPPAAADVDGDGKVNIADVTALIDMLLSR